MSLPNRTILRETGIPQSRMALWIAVLVLALAFVVFGPGGVLFRYVASTSGKTLYDDGRYWLTIGPSSRQVGDPWISFSESGCNKIPGPVGHWSCLVLGADCIEFGRLNGYYFAGPHGLVYTSRR